MHTGRIVLNRAEVELDSHLALWQQARLGNYSYEYNVLCECSDNFGQPVKVTVTNGEIQYQWSKCSDAQTPRIPSTSGD